MLTTTDTAITDVGTVFHSPEHVYAPTDPRAIVSPKDRGHFCSQYLADRQRGRTDLIWLCNNVLQYPDVNQVVHGPVTQHLQQFLGREEYMDPNTFEIVYSEPMCAIHEDQNCPCFTHLDQSCQHNCRGRASCIGRTCWALPGPHFRMLLDPRGHLKTTVNTIAHSIQWIINFEDIRIALSTATGPQGEEIITEIENHFRFNEKFRFLYPEVCPPGERAGDWGSRNAFVVPNRRRKWLKEPTMKVISVGKVVAGPHYEILKHSDLVDKENVKTPTGIKEVKDHFKYTMPLLERGPRMEGRPLTRGWVDLEGTIYDNSDLYCEELDKDDDRSSRGEPCRWAVFRRDSFVNVPADVDYAMLWSGRIPNVEVLWADRFPFEELRAIFEDVGEYMFNCQYRLRPSSKSMSLATAAEIGYFPARFRDRIKPTCFIKTTVDLAGMEEDSEGCNNAIVTVGHGRDNRKYVFEALVGRPSPFDIINYLFELDLRYSTLQQKLVIQMEKAHHASALLPFINREMEVRQQYLNIIAIPRDSSVSKDNRIFYGLQPWFRRRQIWFADDIKPLGHCIKEVTLFPKYKFKDFVDALSDQFQTKDGKVDHQTDIPSPRTPVEDHLKVQGKFIGFDPITKQPRWSDDSADVEAVFGTMTDDYIYARNNMTGAL